LEIGAEPYNGGVLQQLRSRARALETETHAVYLAARDRRTPWAARLLILAVVAYALSPIDLIPDFIPVLGYVDDLIIIPAGIALALRFVPSSVMADARQRASAQPPGRRLRLAGAAIIISLWLLAIIAIIRAGLYWIRSKG
jgi:uncharacterized membrane protein YkvA (DUF1232 family)